MKKLLFVLLVVIYSNCSDKKDLKSIDQFINLFSRGDFEKGLPTANDFFFFFIKINKKEIAKLYNSDLYFIYKNQYSNDFNDYHSFLLEIYTNDLIINDDVSLKKIQNLKVEVFKIDNLIQDKNLEELIKKYKLTKNEEFSTITIKTHLDQKTLNNISYKFFKNQYGVFDDCISGYTRMAIPKYE